MSAREVVTVQCGHFSNFVGTHWWNVQEAGFCYDAVAKEPREILHDCLFREGLTLTGQQTYTPRLIAIDLPGSLKTLKEDGSLYDTTQRREEVSAVWQGGVDVHVTDAAAKNEFLDNLDRENKEEEEEEEEGGAMATGEGDDRGRAYHLDDSVEVWSDFLRIHLHSKSLVMVPGHFHNDSNDSFGTFPAGLDSWANKRFQRQLEDRLHFFVEECDRLQGFHLLCDWSDGFGGLASCIAQELRDEYSGKAIFTVLSSPHSTPLNKLPKFYPSVFNHLLSLAHLSESSSLLLPLSPLVRPWQDPTSLRGIESECFNPSLPYHSSALFASALETVTLLYRTHHNLTSLPSLSDTLTAMGRKVCSAGVSLPFSLPPSSTLASQLSLSPLPSSLTPLSPFSHRDDTLWSLATSLRGTPPDYPLCSGEDLGYSVCSHPSHVLAVHLADTVPSINSQLCCIQKPLPLATPFPHILPTHYMKSGQAPVCASLQTQSGTHQLLHSLASLLAPPTRLRLYPAYTDSCLDPDSCSEHLHTLLTLAECYSTGEPLSDEDSD